MRRAPRLVAAMAAMTLLAAACSDDDAVDAGGGEPADEQAVDDEAMDDNAMDDDAMDDEAMDDDAMEESMTDEEMADGEMMDGVHTFRITLTNTSGDFAVAATGAQTVPVDGEESGPALPGSGYEFRVPRSGDVVSFASMFVQTNDWFWSFGPGGLPLVGDDGAPTSGDVTDRVSLWDAGTELDEEPGQGENQAPRQGGPDIGADDPDATVRQVDGVDPTDYLRVTLTPADDGSTVVRIDNVSDAAPVPGPIAPVAWAVHGADVAFFPVGGSASPGLEMLAEDGGPGLFVEELAPVTGTTTPFAPVAWTVGAAAGSLVTPGGEASPGLEMLAEDGGPGVLVDELVAAGGENSGAATNPDGGGEAGPALPGSSYEFEVTAGEDGLLSLASMFVQSNDWFVALVDVPLYEDGSPISGDLSDRLALYDAGTEADQPVGAGPDQAPRQAGPDTGADDDDPAIRAVDVDLDGHLTVEIEVIG